MDEVKLKQGISNFKWYQPVNFGKGVATENWAGPHTKVAYEFGIKKWNFILERNFPDVQGLRVLDIGCNCGLYCVQLSRMGAKEVVGVDSEATWPSWENQAHFVKESLEWRCGTTYNISFVDTSMDNIRNLDLGRFDVVMALCSIYYIDKSEIHALLKHFKDMGCTKIVLQGNTNRGDQVPEVYQKAKPQFLAEMLKGAGYSYVSIDEPLFYSRPVVVGSTTPFEIPAQARIDKLRDWIRRKI